MTNPYQQMAKQFMDLWQKQVSTVVSDKEFIQAMLDLTKQMQNPENYGKTSPTSSASDPADAPDAQHGDMAQLAFRLSQCEKRIAALEGKKRTAKPVRSTKRRSTKPRK
ncbi:MAG: hypothetical protein ACN2B6_03795 [Rickettsiales bacterium]